MEAERTPEANVTSPRSLSSLHRRTSSSGGASHGSYGLPVLRPPQNSRRTFADLSRQVEAQAPAMPGTTCGDAVAEAAQATGLSRESSRSQQDGDTAYAIPKNSHSHSSMLSGRQTSLSSENQVSSGTRGSQAFSVQNQYSRVTFAEVAVQKLKQQEHKQQDEDERKGTEPFFKCLQSPSANLNVELPQTTLQNQSSLSQEQKTHSSLLNTHGDLYAPSMVPFDLSAEMSKQHRQQLNHAGGKFEKGAQAATALAVVLSLLGQTVLNAIISPNEVIFSGTKTDEAYCDTFDGNSCERWKVIYTLACSTSLTFNLLALLCTIPIAIGMVSWLEFAYGFFVL
jgi:hypothetical protein